MSPIRIFIVDDHPMVIEGLRNMLQTVMGIEVAGFATTAAACLAYLKAQHTDVILMDINLPDGNGVDLCGVIKQQYPDTHVVGLSTMNHPSTVREMKENGASGYLLKSSSDVEIIQAIETVYAGGEAWGSSVARPEARNDHGVLLTRREKEILSFLKSRLTPAEIAEKISISEVSVDLHLKSMLIKFKCSSLEDLIRIVMTANL